MAEVEVDEEQTKVIGRPRKNQARLITTVQVSQDFYDLSRKYGIKFSEALRVGIAMLLAERGVLEYDNNLNVVRRLSQTINKLSETSQELYELKEQFK